MTHGRWSPKRAWISQFLFLYVFFPLCLKSWFMFFCFVDLSRHICFLYLLWADQKVNQKVSQSKFKWKLKVLNKTWRIINQGYCNDYKSGAAEEILRLRYVLLHHHNSILWPLEGANVPYFHFSQSRPLKLAFWSWTYHERQTDNKNDHRNTPKPPNVFVYFTLATCHTETL